MTFILDPSYLAALVCLTGIAYNLGRESQRKAEPKYQAQAQAQLDSSLPAPISQSSTKRKTKPKTIKSTSTKIKSSKRIEAQLQNAIDTPLEGVSHHKTTTKREKGRSDEGKRTKRRKREYEPKTEKIEPPWSPLRQFLEESGHADRIRERAYRKRLVAMEEEKKRECGSKEEKIETTLSPTMKFLEESGHADRIREKARLRRVAAIEAEKKLLEKRELDRRQELGKRALRMKAVEEKCEESLGGKAKAFGEKKMETVTRWIAGVVDAGEGWNKLDLEVLQEVGKAEGFRGRKGSKRVETRYREVDLKRLY